MFYSKTLFHHNFIESIKNLIHTVLSNKKITYKFSIKVKHRIPNKTSSSLTTWYGQPQFTYMIAKHAISLFFKQSYVIG